MYKHQMVWLVSILEEDLNGYLEAGPTRLLCLERWFGYICIEGTRVG